ncbi:uncharacterized mitochondrial protein-like protein [Tanacetum coccineum]
MRVFNKRTRIVEETLNIRFLENVPNVTGNGPDWIFDVDSMSKSMNYVPVVAGNQTNGIAGKRDNIVAGQAEKKKEPEQEYILIPICTTDLLISQDPKVCEGDTEEKPTEMDKSGASDKDGKDEQATRSDTPVSAVGPSFTYDDPSSPVNIAEASNAFEDHLFERFSPFKNAFILPHVSNVTPMDDTRIFDSAYDDEDVGVEANLNNLEITMNVSPIPTIRIDKYHPKDQIIRDLNSAIQTWRMTKISNEHAMIEAIKLFLAYTSFMGFIVYRMGVKSAFLYGTIEEEVYVYQPPGFEDPQFLDKVYKHVVDAQEILDEFYRGAHFLFRVAIKTASTPIETNKALLNDEEAEDVDVHLYRSMIRSLMYLIASRPDIMFAVCACARFQVTPKVSHLHAVKRIFRYLKDQPKLGLWELVQVAVSTQCVTTVAMADRVPFSDLRSKSGFLHLLMPVPSSPQAGYTHPANIVVNDVVDPSNVSIADHSTSTARDIFEDKMMTIADTLVAIRSTRRRTTSSVIVIFKVDAEIARQKMDLKKDKRSKRSFKRKQMIARERDAEQEANDAAALI